MSFERLPGRTSRSSALRAYGLAFVLVGIALLVRALLDLVAPGIAYFVVLLPAVVLAGVFCGTAPAAVAAAVGLILTDFLFLGRSLLSWPPFDAAQVDTLLFLPACATILWATHVLRRAAAAAAAAEARLAEVFRQVPGAAAILEAPDGRLLLRSSQSDAVLGHHERPFESSGDIASYGGLHPDGRPYAPDEYPIVRALKTGEVVHAESLQYLRPNGELADLEVHAGPVRDAGARIVASVGMAFDVSERAHTERRLKTSEAQHRAMAERLRAAVDAGALGLWEFDLASRRIKIDAAFGAMLGLPAEDVELDASEMARLTDPADLDRAGAVFAGAVAEGGPYADELSMRSVQGEPRWLVTRGAVLAEAGKVVGVVSDVTERRRRENALQDALKARDVLMYEADHRIKNSLQLVVSLLTLQASRARDPDAKAALRETIARVNAVAHAHLALQRSPDLKSIEIDGMLRDLCGRVGPLNPAIAIRCEADSGLSLDAELAIPLGLIASELLTNALRHAYPPGDHGEVVLTLAVRAAALEMTVADRGRGLPDTPRSGLGSNVIDSLARQIGACVDRRSPPEGGATVVVAMKPP
jgi:PAS domain S-box-containing protein